jgi:hypothetical protein
MLGIYKPSYWLDWFNEVQATQAKVTESASTLDVNDGKTSGLGTNFLNCRKSTFPDCQVPD